MSGTMTTTTTTGGSGGVSTRTVSSSGPAEYRRVKHLGSGSSGYVNIEKEMDGTWLTWLHSIPTPPRSTHHSEAWLYHHHHTPIVVKQIDFDPIASPLKARKLANEIKALKQVSGHPNIVAIKDCWVVVGGVGGGGGMGSEVSVGEKGGEAGTGTGTGGVGAGGETSSPKRWAGSNPALKRYTSQSSSLASFLNLTTPRSIRSYHIAMEYANGRTLQTLLDHRRQLRRQSYQPPLPRRRGRRQDDDHDDGGGGGENDAATGRPFKSKEAFFLFFQLLSGLKFLHCEKRLLHRDLKPENVLVCISPFHTRRPSPPHTAPHAGASLPDREEEEEDQEDQEHDPTTLNVADIMLKIADLGCVQAVSSDELETVEGTVRYLSPEVCEGGKADERADLWALGCVYFELLSLETLFEGESLGATVLSIVQNSTPTHLHPRFASFDPDTTAILRRLLERDVKGRVRDTETLMGEIRDDWKMEALVKLGLRWG